MTARNMTARNMSARNGTTVWAGRILAALGVVHLGITLVLSAKHVPGWLKLGLWDPGADMGNLPANIGAFWMSYGSFGLPLLLLGCLVATLGGRGARVPAYVGWGVGAWALVGAYVLEPTPFLLALIPAGMVVAQARGEARAQAGS